MLSPLFFFASHIFFFAASPNEVESSEAGMNPDRCGSRLFGKSGTGEGWGLRWRGCAVVVAQLGSAFGLHGLCYLVLVQPLYFKMCVCVWEREGLTVGGSQHQIHTK